MKKSIYFLALSLFICQYIVAQTGGINFQGLARNASGEVLVNQKITLRFSVLLSSETGTIEYQESKETTTNAQGMFSLVIGEGSILTKTGNFSDINWKVSPKFLKVEMDPSAGTNFTLMGTSKLQAVPFAYYANGVDAENVQGVLPAVKGGTGVASISALKGALQLDQVNNTADVDKPLSTATQTALATKVDKVEGKELSTNDFSTEEKTKLAAITGTNTGDQDLSGFATTIDLTTKANTFDVTTALATKVDKVEGKELSTNDFTTEEKTKLAAITGINTGDQDLSGFATTTDLTTKANTFDVTTALATKVDKVEGKELSTNDFSTEEKTKLAAITGTNTGDQDLSGFATTADLITKANTSDVATALATKVDKVQGKELSTNDYTTAEKTKLAAITGTNTGDQDLSGYATTADLATKASTASVITSLNLKEDVSNKSILTDLGGQSTSDVLYPSQKAVKTYVDTQISNGGIADGSITSQKIANGTLTNADINSSAAIAYGKLDLTGSIVANDISSTAAIPFSKLAISKSDVVGLGIPGSDTNTTYSAGSGLTLSGTTFSIGSGAITSTEIGDGTLVNADINSSAAIAYGKLDLSGSIVASDISSTAAIPFSKLAISKSDVMGLGIPGSDTNTTYSAGSGLSLSGTTFSIGSGAITSTEIADGTITNSKISGPISVANGGTGAASFSANQVLLGNGTNPLQEVAPGNSGNVLTSNGTTWVSAAPTNSSTFTSDITVNGIKVGRGNGNVNGNTAFGNSALSSNSSGFDNLALGVSSGSTITSGRQNTMVGAFADVSTSAINNAIAIGYLSRATESNTVTLGNGNISKVITAGQLVSGLVTYPNTTGTNGQVLTSNGAGSATWQNVSSSGSVVIGGGSDDYGITYLAFGGNFTADWVNSKLNYMRIGNMVFFNAIIGKFTMNANQQVEFEFKPPIASAFTSTSDAIGTITAFKNGTNVIVSGTVSANPVYDNFSNSYKFKNTFTVANENVTDLYVSISGSYIIK